MHDISDEPVEITGADTFVPVAEPLNPEGTIDGERNRTVIPVVVCSTVTSWVIGGADAGPGGTVGATRNIHTSHAMWLTMSAPMGTPAANSRRAR